ncbi:hypothetical protein F5Y12DRAFT_796062 [Xylaria sp. FL1777]|nr:hypothetical protein F5Y12DRAFT_796062 [Xylaria sp. FL1777]
MTTTVKADTDTLEYAVDAFRAALDKLEGVENLLLSITFEPIPVSLIEQSISRGGNSLGLKPSDGPLVVVLLYASWISLAMIRESMTLASRDFKVSRLKC